jgi:hypothetical protein
MSFRRREPLHERLAREAGMTAQPPPHEPGPHWGEVGIHGLHRPREWDALITVEAELPGDLVRFVALPDGEILVEEAESADVGVLADAIEAAIAPPYRAEAVRRERGVWAVGALRVDVVELADDPGGEVIQLVWNGSERTAFVDAAPSLVRLRELEALGASRFEAYVVDAERLDGSLWEARVTPL